MRLASQGPRDGEHQRRTSFGAMTTGEEEDLVALSLLNFEKQSRHFVEAVAPLALESQDHRRPLELGIWLGAQWRGWVRMRSLSGSDRPVRRRGHQSRLFGRLAFRIGPRQSLVNFPHEQCPRYCHPVARNRKRRRALQSQRPQTRLRCRSRDRPRSRSHDDWLRRRARQAASRLFPPCPVAPDPSSRKWSKTERARVRPTCRPCTQPEAGSARAGRSQERGLRDATCVGRATAARVEAGGRMKTRHGGDVRR